MARCHRHADLAADFWPVHNPSRFESRPGGREVPPDDPKFHVHHREVGSFTGWEGARSQKESVTQIYSAVGSPLTPIL